MFFYHHSVSQFFKVQSTVSVLFFFSLQIALFGVMKGASRALKVIASLFSLLAFCCRLMMGNFCLRARTHAPHVEVLRDSDDLLNTSVSATYALRTRCLVYMADARRCMWWSYQSFVNYLWLELRMQGDWQFAHGWVVDDSCNSLLRARLHVACSFKLARTLFSRCDCGCLVACLHHAAFF